MGQHSSRRVILCDLLKELVVHLHCLLLQLLGEDQQVEQVEIVGFESVLDFLTLRIPLPELEQQLFNQVYVD